MPEAKQNVVDMVFDPGLNGAAHANMYDYFAARAGWAPEWFEPLGGDGVQLVAEPSLTQQIQRQVRWCYTYAEAMVAERTRRLNP